MAFDGKTDFTSEVRAVEQEHLVTHHAMIEWGIWSRRWRDSAFPDLHQGGIYSLKGDPDPNRDPDAAPEPVKVQVNERLVAKLDDAIHKPACQLLWRRIAKANYVFVVPEPQRPWDAGIIERNISAREAHSIFLLNLDELLSYLDKSTR